VLFVTLVKLRKKPSKADMERMKAGLKESKIYFTLGRYDAVIISECPDEKAHMKTAMQFVDLGSSESMVAVPAEEAEKLLE
jgi:uncharacterized protein with GYD domain